MAKIDKKALEEVTPDNRIVKMDFPANSHTKKNEKKEERTKQNKVVTGIVVKQKKSLSKRLTETFLGDDIDNVASYVIHDILVPAAKNTVTDLITGGLEMMLFGEVRGSRTKRDKGRSHVSYSNYYKADHRDESRKASNRNRAAHDFDDIILETRGEAEEVLSHLVDLTIDYGMASVADLYDLVGITSNFTDNKFGWADLNSASVQRVRNGYMIHLPKTISLD